MATTKDGIEMVATETTPTSRSTSVPRRTAERQPSGIPSTTAQPRPNSASASVCGRASMTMVATLRLLITSTPRSPRRVLPKKYRTCRTSGWSRPMRARSAAFIASLARGPNAMLAGSPGMT